MQGTAMANVEVCTTQKAAEVLGLSVTSVQQLVETGAIEAWKTKGGHRRIPLAAVQTYKALMGKALERKGHLASSGRPVILVIEDNELQREIYEKQISSWDLKAELKFCENGYQALIEIASNKPDIVLTDIVMAGIDGYEVITTVLDYPALANTNFAILSMLSREELDMRGGIPEDVVFFSKPINYDELRGFLRACCAQYARRS